MLSNEVGILVVEDVNSIRVQIRVLLKDFGFKNIFLAESAETAMLTLEIESIQLIICDWYLNVTDGIDFLKYIRTHPQHKKTAFVMISAENTKEKVIQAIQAGVDDYLIKPMTKQMVETKVFGALYRKGVLL